MRTRMTLITIALLVAVTALFVTGSVAGGLPAQGSDVARGITLAGTVASKISYQGRLTDAGGNPLDGSYNLVFQLWDDATAGSQVGGDMVKNNVPVSDGLFTVELDVPQDAFNGQALWLRIQVNGQWLLPRQELLPVPYALSLKPGAHVEGDSSDTIFSATNSGSGDALRGSTSNPSGHGVYGEATNSGDVRNYGGFFVAEGTRGRGVYGKAANAADEINYGGFFYASGVQGRGVFGQATGSSGMGVKGWASDEGDVENYGGHFTASGSRGIGVYAEGSNLGVQAESDGWAIYGNGYIGVGGFGLKPRDGRSYGGYFDALGSHARGVEGVARSEGDAVNYGGYFESRGNEGRGVLGVAVHDGDTRNYGGHFRAAGQQGIGVYGAASDEGDASKYGGYFEAKGGDAVGVYGQAGELFEDWSGTGVHGKSFNGIGVRGTGWGSNGIGVFAEGGPYGVYAESPSTGVWAEATGSDGTGIYAKGGSDGYAAQFRGNVILRSWSSGATIMELGEGLDYAEGFDVSDKNEIVPGSVLIIDPDNPGKLTISDQAYDTKVAGIVAGGQGQGSGVRLGVDQFDFDVALAGRVYCNVDATDAGVEPGDLLTTSATPGYAMKATDYGRAQGAILGKAMEGLEQGERGQILVLVTLQ